MRCKDLITQLEKLIADNEPHKRIMGEAEVMIDVFHWNEERGSFDYQGFSPEVRITKSADGVYDILTAAREQVKRKSSTPQTPYRCPCCGGKGSCKT